jgi:hypothetical protein
LEAKGDAATFSVLLYLCMRTVFGGKANNVKRFITGLAAMLSADRQPYWLICRLHQS